MSFLIILVSKLCLLMCVYVCMYVHIDMYIGVDYKNYVLTRARTSITQVYTSITQVYKL